MNLHRKIVVQLVLLVGIAYSASAQLKINEIYYNVTGSQSSNQFVELYNAGTSNFYLDGLILSDETTNGVEGVFLFPGTGTQYPVSPGGFVVIAVDAAGARSNANWECYAGITDYDNPAVPNLALISGAQDLSLSPSGDNVLLLTGADTTSPFDSSSIIDGVNFEGGGGELAQLSAIAQDANPNLVCPQGFSINRCNDGVDSDTSSSADLSPHTITPGSPNACGSSAVLMFINDVLTWEGDSGVVNSAFSVTLSAIDVSAISVDFTTADSTAAAGSDYTATNGTLTFNPGNQTQMVNVIISGDTDFEQDETFVVNLSNPVNVTFGDSQGVGTIRGDDHSFSKIANNLSAVITNTWNAVSGATYRVQFTTNLSNTATWSNLANDVVATNISALKVDTNPVSNVKRTYRVMRIVN